MTARPGSRRPTGLLPVVQALVGGEARFDVASLDAGTVARAIEAGLGAPLAYVARESPTLAASPHAPSIRAADLTARVLSGELFDGLRDVLSAAHARGCEPLLLKGCATALRCYPSPHLRTMGDADLLVSAAEVRDFEAALRELGFEARRPRRAPDYDRHHHGMPFWHPRRSTWLEVHTRLFPPDYPLAGDPRFAVEDLLDGAVPVDVGGVPGRAMADEAQLVYTASRWAEMLNPDRGVLPLADAALLLRVQGEGIDWDRIVGITGGTWAATAVRLLLECLARWDLADVPRAALRRIADRDPYGNPLLVALERGLVRRYVLEGRRPGRFLTRRNLRTTWSTLVGPTRPGPKPLLVPLNIAFPPGEQGRFAPGRILSRLRGLRAEGSRRRPARPER